MIFGKQNVLTALSYISYFYNKIILVNTNDDTFQPIKIDENEWKSIPDHKYFSKWVDSFIKSDIFLGNPNSLKEYLNTEILKAMKKPDNTSYWRKVDGEEHWITLEIIPIGAGMVYVFVKDMSKMLKTETI